MAAWSNCCLLAWINLILFLKRVPLLGIYVLMFNAILQSFLKFALIAFLFVVAFCIAFYMILYKAVSVSAKRVLCACVVVELTCIIHICFHCLCYMYNTVIKPHQSALTCGTMLDLEPHLFCHCAVSYTGFFT